MVIKHEELGDKRQRKFFYHRVAAFSTTLLAGAIFRAHYVFPWAFPFYIIAFWSFLDAALRFKKRNIHPIISVVLDSLSTIFIVCHALLMAIDWLLEGNGYSLLVSLLLTIAPFFHGKVCTGAAVHYWKFSRRFGKARHRGGKSPV